MPFACFGAHGFERGKMALLLPNVFDIKKNVGGEEEEGNEREANAD